MSEDFTIYYNNTMFMAGNAQGRAEGKTEERNLIFQLIRLVSAGKTDQEILSEVKEASLDDIKAVSESLK